MVSVSAFILLHAASFALAAFQNLEDFPCDCVEDVPYEISWERFEIDLEKPHLEQPSDLRQVVFARMSKQRAVTGQHSAARNVDSQNQGRAKESLEAPQRNPLETDRLSAPAPRQPTMIRGSSRLQFPNEDLVERMDPFPLYERAEDIPYEIAWKHFEVDLEKSYLEQPNDFEIRQMAFADMMKQRAVTSEATTTNQSTPVNMMKNVRQSVVDDKSEEHRKRKRSEGSFERSVDHQKRARKLDQRTPQTQGRPRERLEAPQQESHKMDRRASSQSAPAPRKPTMISCPRRLYFPKEDFVERNNRSGPIPATVIITDPRSVEVRRKKTVQKSSPAFARPAPSPRAAKIFNQARHKKTVEKSSPPVPRTAPIPRKLTMITAPKKIKLLQNETVERSASRSGPVHPTPIIAEPQGIKVRRIRSTEKSNVAASRPIVDFRKPTMISAPKRINFAQNETVERSPSRETLIIPDPKGINVRQTKIFEKVRPTSARAGPQRDTVLRQKTVETISRAPSGPAPSPVVLELPPPKSILKRKAENQLQNPAAKARKTLSWGSLSEPMVQERGIERQGKSHKTPRRGKS